MSETEEVPFTVPPPADDSAIPAAGQPDKVTPIVASEMELPDGRYLIAYRRAADPLDA